MLMPVLEYNKHIAKIPNCKMRSLRARMQQLLLMLLLLFGHSDVTRALDNAANSGAAAAAAAAAAAGAGAGSTSLSGPAGALNANLTDLGSPVTHSTHNKSMYYYNEFIRRDVVDRQTIIEPGLINKFIEIDSSDRYWDFILYTFLPFLNSGDFNVKSANESKDLNEIECIVDRTIKHENVLIGPPRLRQIRVKEGTWRKNPTFFKHMQTCYGPYSWTNENHGSYHGRKWKSLWEDNAMPIFGKIEVYLGAGHIESFSYDKYENVKLVETLRDCKWIDRATRMVILELNLYHIHTHLFESAQLLVERPSTGGLVPSICLHSVRRETFFTDPSLTMATITCIYYLMVTLYLVRDIILIVKIGFCNYIGNLVNFLDALCYLGSYILLVFQVMQHFHIQIIMKDVRKCNKFINLDWANTLTTIHNNVAGLVIFVVWIRVITFLIFNRTMVILKNVVRKSINEIIGALLILFVVLMAYAECGMIFFGGNDKNFYSLQNSMLTMLRWVVCAFSYTEIRHPRQIKTCLYYLSFVIVVYMVLVSSFLAIVNSTYEEVKSSTMTRPTKLALVIRLFFRNIYHRISRERKQDIKYDKDSKHELEADQRVSSQIAAQRAAMRRTILQNPVTLTQAEYLPGRLERAEIRINSLEEVTGPLLRRLLKYYNKLRVESGLSTIQLDAEDNE